MSVDLSIIIVNWNTKDFLEECLISLMQHCCGPKYEIIVVDNASGDASVDMVRSRFPEVSIIESGANLGFGKANNLAIPHSTGANVLFLNPDTVMLKGTTEKMIDFIKHNPDVGAIGCRMKGPPDSQLPYEDAHPLGLQWFPSLWVELFSKLFLTDGTIQLFKKFLPYHDPTKNGYVVKLFGGCLMVRKEVLETVGSFDERFFMYAEDADLSRRIVNAGWKLYYMSEAEIIHICGKASEKAGINLSHMMQCESICKYMDKYYGTTGKILYKWIIFLRASISLMALLVLRAISFIFTTLKMSDYRQRYEKNLTSIKWSLGILKFDKLQS
jgi:N-acetylglucosaminyl-diphospho-decaprenol L-rhamnosyltransferase